ncbi:hypothetical protein [Sphingomonas sp. 2SG]|uniref:hypothetical protein n=1 Tax=Sphingomonas sp. 2SG TaxID=2502201 RepID=UPI0010F83581|nr:hypothetical protein [Sphingomonas sp. 2SG]
MKQTWIAAASWCAPLLLAGCGSADGRTERAAGDGATTTTAPASRPAAAAPVAATTPRRTRPLSCAAEIGAAAAARRVAICRNVSPATHPPCNAVNSCALIDDEIARSCALFDGKGAPMPGCTPPPKSAAAAAAVVQRYYAALNAGDYGTAWQQWGDDGRPGQTYAAFAGGFAHTRTTRVTIGTLPPGDAGAGSLYQPVPVTVDATLDDGRHQRFRGRYVVRRVNDVDGASPGQLRWHIDSAQLKPG